MYPFHANGSLDGESLPLGQMQTYEQRKEARCGHNWQKSYKKLHQDILQARRPQKFIVFTCNSNNFNYRAFFCCAQNLRDALAQQTRGFQRDIKLFLATDDKDVKQYALMNYASDVVTLDITPHHITSLQGRNIRRSEPVEGIFNVMLDHFLLSECDFLILSQSTFGLTAAGLKFHPSQTVTFGRKIMHSNDHRGRVEVPSRTNSYVRT